MKSRVRLEKQDELSALIADIERCALCADLPLGPRPVVRLSGTIRLLIISQAPSVKVHETGLPFNDVSGDRLRAWLGMDRAAFYDVSRVGFMPMGFCYPGRMVSRAGQRLPGDAPPRTACAPQWHDRLLALLPPDVMTLLVGQYAQERYLPADWLALNVTERCARWLEMADAGEALPFIPMVHPSPRNKLWCQRNPWFEQRMMPLVRKRLAALPA